MYQPVWDSIVLSGADHADATLTKHEDELAIRVSTGLPDDADVELVPSDKDGVARAFLTVNRDAYYLHLRRMQAIARIISNRFSGRRDLGLSAEEEFNGILSATQIADGLYADSPLLIVEVADELCLLPGPSNNLQALRQALTEIATWH